MILKLTNSTNEYTFEVTDLNHGEKLFYNFQIPTLDVEDGKYNMVITDDNDVVIAEEQVCIGYFNSETIQYQRAENVYINAPLVGKIQEEKNVEISKIETVIVPDDGYDAMGNVNVDAQPVYDNGYNDGETDQKAKLTGITITENGTYSRENGYNEVVVDVPDLNGDYNEGYDAGKVDGYDSGYTAGIDYASENAGEIAAANAIDLVATEFRTYYTKYSDNIVNPNPVTGIYPDGETFYNLANVQNNVYNTGIIVNETTKLEIWYKGDGKKTDDGWNAILNAESNDYDNTLSLVYYFSDNNRLQLKWGAKGYFIDWNDNVLNHLIISSNGIFLNDEKVVDIINTTFTSSVPCVINGLAFDAGRRRANGKFGMIKITTDGITNVIIPTEDGFKNITTDEMLEVLYNKGSYKYIDNAPIVLDNLIKSVDVQPKIDVAEYGIKLSQSTFTEMPSFYDFSNATDMGHMFYECGSLQTIPLIDTSNVTNMYNTFRNCGALQTIPQLDTSNVTNMERTFSDCGSLQTLPTIDTSNVENAGRMFYYCSSLQSMPALNAEKMNLSSYGMFGGTLNALTDFGGLIGLKSSSNNNYSLNCCPNLTYQSCINVLNGLYDFTGNGETPASSQGQLKVHTNFLTTVGDEISIGTNKGWTITA